MTIAHARRRHVWVKGIWMVGIAYFSCMEWGEPVDGDFIDLDGTPSAALLLVVARI